MDCSRVGALILSLRKEKNMTQKEIADRLNISDKTVSKWELGMGCHDVTLLEELSDILGVNIEKILAGDLNEKERDGGNMKQVKFYVCKNYFFPTVEAGMFYENSGKLFMPLSMTVHHATTDGWHIKTFLDELQYDMYHPESWTQ